MQLIKLEIDVLVVRTSAVFKAIDDVMVRQFDTSSDFSGNSSEFSVESFFAEFGMVASVKLKEVDLRGVGVLVRGGAATVNVTEGFKRGWRVCVVRGDKEGGQQKSQFRFQFMRCFTRSQQ